MTTTTPQTARELLEKRPWSVDRENGYTCIRDADGAPMVPWGKWEDDAHLEGIVFAVNRLPLYEQAVEALRFILWEATSQKQIMNRAREALAALDDPVDSSTPTPPDSGEKR